jgi:hypothetical protein
MNRLLHGLGKHLDMGRIKRLFVPGTVFLIVALPMWPQLILFSLLQPSVRRLWCSAGKPVFPLMVSALIGGFISPAEATVSWHLGIQIARPR